MIRAALIFIAGTIGVTVFGLSFFVALKADLAAKDIVPWRMLLVMGTFIGGGWAALDAWLRRSA